MKRIILTAAISVLSLFALGQNGDLVLASPVISPAPGILNQSGIFSFTLGYNAYTGDLAYTPGDPMIIDVTLSHVVPDNVDPLAAVSVTGDGWTFDVTYDVGTKTYHLSQTSGIFDGEGVLITINIKHTSPSIAAVPQNGFNINLNFPITFNDQVSANNSLSKYTYTTVLLPVTLSSINVVQDNCDGLLSWATSSELNTRHFEVEYSEDGNNYNKVGQVMAKNIPQGSAYSFKYAQPSMLGFYRLKLVDLDGSYKYSQSVALRNKCKEPKVTLYPNPVGVGMISNLVLKNYGSNIVGKLTDLSGKLLHTYKFVNGVNKFSIHETPSTQYILTVSDDKGNTANLTVTVAK